MPQGDSVARRQFLTMSMHAILVDARGWKRDKAIGLRVAKVRIWHEAQMPECIGYFRSWG
jgi:hypothetical protein